MQFDRVSNEAHVARIETSKRPIREISAEAQTIAIKLLRCNGAGNMQYGYRELKHLQLELSR